MAKVHIHIEGESAADTTRELVSLAALVQGAALGGLIDSGPDVGDAEPEKPQAAAAPKAARGRKADTATAATAAAPTNPSTSSPAPSSASAASTPSPAAAEPAAPAATAAPAGGDITVQAVLNEIQELAAKKVDAGLVQEELQRVFGVGRVSLIPPERRGEAIEVIRAFGAAQAML